MAEKNDLLLSQAKHACFAALGGMTVYGDRALGDHSQYPGVVCPDYAEHRLWSDTIWHERDGRTVRKRVIVTFELEEEVLDDGRP